MNNSKLDYSSYNNWYIAAWQTDNWSIMACGEMIMQKKIIIIDFVQNIWGCNHCIIWFALRESYISALFCIFYLIIVAIEA